MVTSPPEFITQGFALFKDPSTRQKVPLSEENITGQSQDFWRRMWGPEDQIKLTAENRFTGYILKDIRQLERLSPP